MSGTDAMRVAFEDARLDLMDCRDDQFERDARGEYTDPETSMDFDLWQAALASVREPWPDAVQRVWDELESRAGFDGLLDGLETRLCSEIREALRVAIYGPKIPEPGAGGKA